MLKENKRQFNPYRAMADVSNIKQAMYALTKIKGVGRRYSNLVCKKADVDLNKRYGWPQNFH